MNKRMRQSNPGAQRVASSRRNESSKWKGPNGTAAVDTCDDLCLGVVAAPAKGEPCCAWQIGRRANGSAALN